MRSLLLAAVIAAAASLPAFARDARYHAHGSAPHRALVHTRHAAHHVRAHLHMRARQVRHAVHR